MTCKFSSYQNYAICPFNCNMLSVIVPMCLILSILISYISFSYLLTTFESLAFFSYFSFRSELVLPSSNFPISSILSYFCDLSCVFVSIWHTRIIWVLDFFMFLFCITVITGFTICSVTFTTHTDTLDFYSSWFLLFFFFSIFLFFLYLLHRLSIIFFIISFLLLDTLKPSYFLFPFFRSFPIVSYSIS